jgi:hypothetical protein
MGEISIPIHQAGIERVHGVFKVICPPTIAQPFMAGNNAIRFSKSVRDGRTILSSLTGLETFPNREPSDESLGYFRTSLWDLVSWFDLIRSNNFSAGSSAGFWGTSWPAKARARRDGVNLSTWALPARRSYALFPMAFMPRRVEHGGQTTPPVGKSALHPLHQLELRLQQFYRLFGCNGLKSVEG